MNSKRFLSLFVILVILLITVVSAEDKETRSHHHSSHSRTHSKTLSKSTSTSLSRSTTISSSKHIKKLDEDEEDEEEEEKEEEKEEKEEKEDKETESSEDKAEVKTTTTTSTTTTRTTTSTTTTKPTTKTSTRTTTTTTVVITTPSVAPVSSSSSSIGDVQDVPISNAVAPAPVQDAEPIMNPIAPNDNTNGNSFGNANTSSNINTDNNVPKQEGSNSNNVVKISLISIVAVGAVVGVATIGVHAYNKKSGEGRELNIGDIEAQPIITDFGKGSSNDLIHTPVDEYNPYNIMNENNRLYLNNNPYEFKPNYDNFTTTPFEKVEADQNVMNRESIFSENENNAQLANGAYNFNNENQQLPYVQGLPVENGFIEKPVANEIEVENFDMRNSQMPTLVPVEPEIIITKPDEEVNTQDGYKQIIPTVAKMEIIDTPDFNKMTTSMIEDHINNMDLENLASLNSESQPQSQQEQEAGYKEIVPDIQEAVIENFDIEDDQEQEFSAVDNITDTYRAALRATYCSTTDENRFSYRTVDSDHSLLHTMREDANW